MLESSGNPLALAGGYFIDDVIKKFEKNGFTVKSNSYTPTTGGDPDSGEGTYACGPTIYAINISW
jgi:hypothetical protein